MTFQHTKHGLKYNPIGAHVMLHWQDRDLLGEVKRVHRNAVSGAIILTVQHFNGEPWPVQPTSRAVTVLPRR
jgi:hypothetical protein